MGQKLDEGKSLRELWQEWEDLSRLLLAAFWTWKTFLTPDHWRSELKEAEHIEQFCKIVQETMTEMRPLQWNQLEEVARDKRNARRTQSMCDRADNDEE
jgi:hypothetical protein